MVMLEGTPQKVDKRTGQPCLDYAGAAHPLRLSPVLLMKG